MICYRVKELEANAATYTGPAVEGQTELLTASISTVTNSIAIKTSIEEIEGESYSLNVEDVEPERSRVRGKELVGDFKALVDSETRSQVKELEADSVTCVRPTIEGQTELLEDSTSTVTNSIEMKTSIEEIDTNSDSSIVEDVEAGGSRDHRNEVIGDFMASVDFQLQVGSQKTLTQVSYAVDSDSLMDANASKEVFDGLNTNLNDTTPLSPVSETILGNNVGNDDDLSDPMAVVPLTTRKFEDVSETKKLINELPSSIKPAAGGVHLLLKLAVESGSAIVLEDSSLDADIVYEKFVALAKSALPGPVFRHGLKKLVVQGCDVQPNDDLATKEAGRTSDNKVTISSREGTGKKSSKRSSVKDIRADLLNVAPRGSLRVDELAKLLS